MKKLIQFCHNNSSPLSRQWSTVLNRYALFLCWYWTFLTCSKVGRELINLDVTRLSSTTNWVVLTVCRAITALAKKFPQVFNLNVMLDPRFSFLLAFLYFNQNIKYQPERSHKKGSYREKECILTYISTIALHFTILDNSSGSRMWTKLCLAMTSFRILLFTSLFVLM